MDKAKALSLFNQTNWDDTDGETAHAAVSACETAGVVPNAGWVERGAKTSYWFAADQGVLARVTAEQSILTVALRRPRWDAVQVELQGAPGEASLEFTVRLFEKAAETVLRGTGRHAQYLQRFYKDHLLDMMSGGKP